jgi:hypothetical protein
MRPITAELRTKVVTENALCVACEPNRASADQLESLGRTSADHEVIRLTTRRVRSRGAGLSGDVPPTVGGTKDHSYGVVTEPVMGSAKGSRWTSRPR